MQSQRRNTKQYPRKLREAAVQEVAAAKAVKTKEPKFDQNHDNTQRNEVSAEQYDADNWVAKYPGQNSPHIGNGSGGLR